MPRDFVQCRASSRHQACPVKDALHTEKQPLLRFGRHVAKARQYFRRNRSPDHFRILNSPGLAARMMPRNDS